MFTQHKFTQTIFSVNLLWAADSRLYYKEIESKISQIHSAYKFSELILSEHMLSELILSEHMLSDLIHSAHMLSELILSYNKFT